MRRVLRALQILGVLLVVLLVGAWIVSATSRGPQKAVPPIGRIDTPTQFAADAPIRVMTLNLAHGRANGFHQALRRPRTIKLNLTSVSEVIKREAPDIVAVQEADGPSAWSGRFDHVAFVAHLAGMTTYVRGDHVKGRKLAYGTGLMSRVELTDPLSKTFAPSPPTFSKGFVVATVPHPRVPGGIDVVSVHLDFARASVRARQIETLIRTLQARGRPTIIMGDFNTEYAPDGPIGRMMDALEVDAYSPLAGKKTFLFTKKRLDWVLVPKGWTIESHAVLEDVISDHQPVVVTISISE